MKKRVLVTGGCGFVGHHVVEHLLKTTDWSVLVFDKLGVAREIGQLDYIFHLGAETHVDRSIDDPAPFVMTNVVGTMHLLNFARQVKGL